MRKQALCSYLLAPVALAAVCAQAADGLRISVGSDYTSGDYGGTRTTEIWSFPFVVGYAKGPVGLKLTVPFLQVTGSGDVIPGITPVVDDDRRQELEAETEDDDEGGAGTKTPIKRTTSSGLGDIVASASYAFIDNPQAWRLSATGKIKFPTANENKNLGTGKADYALQVDVDRTFGRATPFLALGYRWLGKRRDLDLRDVWYGAVGGALRLGQDTVVDLAYDWGQATSRGSGSIGEFTLGLSHWITNHWKLSGYVLHGVASGSPDWGGGAGLRYAF